jgi:alanine racemase
MVRPGLILYGYYPSGEVKNKISLNPIMNLKSKITFIKRVDARTSISYGRLYFTKRRTYIGSIPVGYGDGYWGFFRINQKYDKQKVLSSGRCYYNGLAHGELGEKYTVRVGDDVLLMGCNGFLSAR